MNAFHILLFFFASLVNSQRNNDNFIVVSTSTTPRPQTDSDDVNTRLIRIEEKLNNLGNLANKPTKTLPKNCQEIKASGTQISGLYRVQPEHAPESFMVACEMDKKGGGWTYLLNRFNGSQNFFLGWSDYKSGFGNLLGEFWLGLEHLYELTGFEINELLVELVDWDSKTVYAQYNAFSIGSENEGYSLKILGGFSGDMEDSLAPHAGRKFSTKDKDQDEDFNGSCASYYKGAWWYKRCMDSHLTGQYYEEKDHKAHQHSIMYWNGFRGPSYSLKEARMMVRPRQSSETLRI